jgi:starvation-inducible outer membrane lipoprotein
MAIDHRLYKITLIGIVVLVLTGCVSKPVQVTGEPVHCHGSPVARPAGWVCGDPR